MIEGFGLNLETIGFVGLLVFGLGYVYNQFQSGSGKARDEADRAQLELIQTLTAQLGAQKEINASLQNQINALTAEVGRLSGIKEANDQKIQEYLQIIANRSPDLEETLTMIEQSVQQVVPFMADVKRWHNDIREALKIDGRDRDEETLTTSQTRTITQKQPNSQGRRQSS